MNLIKKHFLIILKTFSNKLKPVYKAIEITRRRLNKKKSLISFIGAPWTLLIYMFDIKIDNEVNLIKLNNKRNQLEEVINELIKYLCLHIQNQINAGADVIQIFDSWAGLIPVKNLNDYCYLPNARIIEFVKKGYTKHLLSKGLNKNYKDLIN